MTESIERHKNYKDLSNEHGPVSVDNPIEYFSTSHLRNSYHPFAADGWHSKKNRTERYADMVDFEGDHVSEKAFNNLQLRLEQMREGEISQEEADNLITFYQELSPQELEQFNIFNQNDLKERILDVVEMTKPISPERERETLEKFLEARENWENMRIRIQELHKENYFETDEKGYPINPNREASDVEGMGELWKWGPIFSANAAVTTKRYNPEIGIEETYLWCVKKEGETEWRLPGGVVNEGAKGELVESPSEAAARELKEESGMSANFSKEDLRFSGTSTGSRQTKHTWFQDTLFHVEVQNGLEMQIENGEDETQRNIETGEIIEKGEIAEKGWQKISPEFWDTFNPSHRRMLEAGLQDLFKENKIEYVHEKEPQEDN